MSKERKLLIFDIDGTLVNSFRKVFTIYDQLAQRFNIDHSKFAATMFEIWEKKLKYSRFMLLIYILKLTKGLNIPPWYWPMFLAAFLRMKTAALNEYTLFPGTKAIIRELSSHSHLVLVAVTDTPQQRLVKLQRLHPVFMQFKELVSFQSFKRCKPDTYVPRLLMEKYNISGENVICIGDFPVDVRLANALGGNVIIRKSEKHRYFEPMITKYGSPLFIDNLSELVTIPGARKLFSI